MEVTISLNARLQPIHRYEIEDFLTEVFAKNNYGEVVGGGTLQNQDGEIVSCDIDVDLYDEDTIDWLIELLNNIDLPKGSSLLVGDQSYPVGTLEGLALYLNGSDLDSEVYQSCDINYVVGQLVHVLDDNLRMFSYQEMQRYTALFFYGASFEEIKMLITPFVETYPLCQKSIIKQIA